MQETKLADGAFPTMPFAGLGYDVAYHGNGRGTGGDRLAGGPLRQAHPGFEGEELAGIEECRLADSRSVAACGWRASTCRTAGRSQRAVLRQAGMAGAAPPGPRRALLGRRAPRVCGTSTSPRRTATSSTSPRSTGHPRSEPERKALGPSSTGDCTTPSGASIPTKARCSPGGTTGRRLPQAPGHED